MEMVFQGVLNHILALCAYIAVLFAANILAVKRYRAS